MTDATRVATSDLAIPPGETLRETLEHLGFSQAELARRMGRPLKTVNEIIQGKAQITPDTAIQFEKVLGVPASFWNNLEKHYQLTLATIRANEQLREEVEHLSDFPYREMAKFGWVALARSPEEKVRELQAFFGVASLRVVSTTEHAAFRVAKPQRVNRFAIAAWLRQGERQALAIETAPFDSDKLRNLLPDFRRLTRESPSRFEDPLVRSCASAGVALVFVRHLTKTYANGAVRWQGPRAIVQLSLRYRWSDIFWFTFFHELGHLLLHRRGSEFVDYDGAPEGPMENAANRFAADTLIPPNAYADLVAGHLTRARILEFAERVGVAPGIVVGRLQYERKIGQNIFNDLRPRFSWASGV